MTATKERIIIQALLSLFGKVDIHTDKDRILITELYKMLKETEE